MTDEGNENSDRKISLVKAASFIGGITVISAVAGFGLTVGRTRKSSPESFDHKNQDAVRLALKALGYGTLLSVSGVGMLVYAVKRALGVENAKDFGKRMKEVFPEKDGKLVSYFEAWRIPRKKESDTLTESSASFSSSKET